MLFCYFNGLRTNNHFLLHLFQPIEELLLFRFGFIFSFFSLSNFIKQYFLFLLLKIGLILNVTFILFGFLLELLFFLGNFVLELSHFLLIFNMYNFLNNVGSTNYSIFLHDFLWVNTCIQHTKLLFKLGYFILILS